MSTGSPVQTPPTVPKIVGGFSAGRAAAIVPTKILGCHLDRLAVVYARQSTPQQVLDHRESTALQYALADRAQAWGWPSDRILVIDEDLGRSGTTIAGRLGFQRLLAEVGLDHVGIILGTEMSKLARSSKDWYQLLELCAIYRTLLADFDGVYDAAVPNDRLLLGLKGTMSEAELYTMRVRLQQGRLNKARRCEHFGHPPMGYVRSTDGFVLDPDEQVRHVVQLIFDKYAELGSTSAVLRYLVGHGIRLGIRPFGGAKHGQLEWRPPCLPTLLVILHNPIYAGAYAYGRYRIDPRRKTPGKPGSGLVKVPPAEWAVLERDRLPAYITWEQYVANQKRLEQNRPRMTSQGPVRRGDCLLSGLAFCGKCGQRLAPRYGGTRSTPAYVCVRHRLNYARPACQSLVARGLDELVSRQVLRVLEPAGLELSLQAAADLHKERERLTRHWQQRQERARYDADRAARQYHAVEPENRLVARELERRWEKALLEQRQLDEEFARFQCTQPAELSATERAAISALAQDFPALWQAATTTPADRKTIVRLLVERIVVTVQGKTEHVDVTIHWSGGFSSQHALRRPVGRCTQLHDYPHLIACIAELRQAKQTGAQIAEHLNREGFQTATGRRFTHWRVRQLWSRLGDNRRVDPVTYPPPRTDEWYLGDFGRKFQIPAATLHSWRSWGWLNARKLPGVCGEWIIWADADELERIGRMRSKQRRGGRERHPPELTTPKRRDS